MFFKGSRYDGVTEATYTDPSGREIPYKLVRFIPATPAQQRYRVREGDRLDHIAFNAYQDAELFWKICDANDAMWPDDLVTQPGEQILIPPAES